MSSSQSTPSQPGTTSLLLGLSALTLFIHLAVNAFGSYGIFRDELYYLACSHRLAVGFVDQPPLSIFLLAFNRLLLGDSLFALRFLPAVCHALTVFLAGLIARRLGGGRRAQALAALAALVAPIYLNMTYYSMNSWVFVFWALGFYFLARLIEAETPRLWLALGVVTGLGLLNKIDFLWFGAGLALAVLLTPLRRSLKTPWPFVAGGLALAIFSPYIIWNLSHGLPHLEFIRNVTFSKYAGLTRLDFLMGQAILLNPLAIPLWLAGLFFLFFGKTGREHRALAIVWLVAFAILVGFGRSKPEYLAPGYTILFAAGATAFERASNHPGRRGLMAGTAAVLTLSAAIIAPMAFPILPIKAYISYARFLDIQPVSAERKQLSDLPQFYADMFGWEELARDVSAVYLALPEDEKAATVVLAMNYGEAGALEYYAKRYPVPPVYCGHNNYWLWGPPRNEVRTVIILPGKEDDHRKGCEKVELMAVHHAVHAMPYENDIPIFLCRGLRRNIHEVWPSFKSYN